jgi:hypothetical protein
VRLVLCVVLMPQGDKDAPNDLKLAIPMLLLSDVMLLNWLGRPQKTNVLNLLHLLKEAAGRVQLRYSTHVDLLMDFFVAYTSHCS